MQGVSFWRRPSDGPIGKLSRAVLRAVCWLWHCHCAGSSIVRHDYLMRESVVVHESGVAAP